MKSKVIYIRDGKKTCIVYEHYGLKTKVQLPTYPGITDDLFLTPKIKDTVVNSCSHNISLWYHLKLVFNIM